MTQRHVVACDSTGAAAAAREFVRPLIERIATQT
jgi:hypothetical protein